VTSRPIPLPSSLSAPFWEATRQGVLTVPHCSRCDRWFFSPEVVCPGCLGPDWIYRAVAGTGSVYSVTVVHRAPGPGFQTPFALAVIDLDEGARMLSQVVGLPPEQVRIGLRVRVRMHALTAEITLPEFVPDDDAQPESR
jgi:hypothetical protein